MIRPWCACVTVLLSLASFVQAVHIGDKQDPTNYFRDIEATANAFVPDDALAAVFGPLSQAAGERLR